MVQTDTSIGSTGLLGVAGVLIIVRLILGGL